MRRNTRYLFITLFELKIGFSIDDIIFLSRIPIKPEIFIFSFVTISRCIIISL